MEINWSDQFPIAEINRADLTEFGLSDEQIVAFTDDCMKKIADNMRYRYHLKQAFWEDFREAIQEVLGFAVQKSLCDDGQDPHKQHLVLSFSRWDLKQIGIPEQQVDDLSDQDIANIVEELRQVYRQAGYMEALNFYARFYLVFRKNKPVAQADNH